MRSYARRARILPRLFSANEDIRRSGGEGEREARPPVEEMVAFIDDRRADHGVEPICRVLPIAPSTYSDRLAKRVDPARLSFRATRDAASSRRLHVYSVRTSGSTVSARSGGN